MMTELVKAELLEEICKIYDSGCIIKYLYARFSRMKCEDCEDAMNDAFAYAVGQLDQLRNPEMLNLWLYKIARNYALMELRRKKYEVETFNRLCDLEEVEATKNSYFDDDIVFKNVERKELTDKLKELHKELPEKYQEVIWLYYVDDFSLKEIAVLLNLNYNSVRSIHVRGLQRLRVIAKEKGVKFDE